MPRGAAAPPAPGPWDRSSCQRPGRPRAAAVARGGAAPRRPPSEAGPCAALERGAGAGQLLWTALEERAEGDAGRRVCAAC